MVEQGVRKIYESKFMGLKQFEEKKHQISFWSCNDRKLFPEVLPKTRIGLTITGVNQSTKAGPTTYDLEKQSFVHDIDRRPLSLKGYVIGSRTKERFDEKIANQDVPEPSRYQNLEPVAIKPAKEPFDSAAERFKLSRTLSTPGVGSYSCAYNPCKRVQYQQSFGRSPVQLPSIKQLSSICSNTDKLSSTIEEKRYNRRLAYLQLFY